MNRVVKLSSLVAAIAVSVGFAQAQPMNVPEEIRVPAGHQLVCKMEAKGVQIYESVVGKNGALEWKFEGPLADLSDQAAGKLGIHYYGPSWEAVDGSKVKKDDDKKAKSVDAPKKATDLPWLLVPVKSDDAANAKPGTLSNVVYVQRLSTSGGKAPAALPKRAGSKIAVPYTAEYYFWAKAE